MNVFCDAAIRPEGLDDEVTIDEYSMPGTITTEPESDVPEDDDDEEEDEDEHEHEHEDKDDVTMSREEGHSRASEKQPFATATVKMRTKKKKSAPFAPPAVDVQVLTVLRMVLKLSSGAE